MTAITGALGVFPEKKQPGSSRDPATGEWKTHVMQWVWGDCNDGTWYVVRTDDQLQDPGNKEFFPTRWEARRYAELRAQGFQDAGALMMIMEERVQQARGGQ